MIDDPLLTPFTLKGLTLRNRIVSTSHEPSYSEGGLPTDRYRAYHVEKAKGGVGLTMIGGSALVTRDSPPPFGNLELWRDESVGWLRMLADEVHHHGAAVMTQLTHMGHRNSSYAGDWLPVVSASNVREPAHRGFAKAAERWDMDRIRDGFVSTAQRCQEAGLDGVELNVYGHFLDSFWTPYWNHRDDEYGETYENRVRYPLEVIRAVRAAVGPDFIVGVRMTFDEQREPGLHRDEALRIAADVTAAGIDFVSAIRGSIATDAATAAMIPPMGTPASPHLEFAGEIRKALSIPVMHAGRIADPATARYAIREGLLDLVGMVRALIADPYLPTKIAQGREDRIRPCVGANMCIDNIYTTGAAYCIHNPSTGREIELPQLIEPAPLPRRVAVVGGGPAGLEAARVLGERGHQVTLFEANTNPGGQLSLAALSPRRRDLQGIVDWRVSELAVLGVTVETGADVSAEELADGWDVIIIATGGLPAAPDIPGGQFVLDTWDVMSGARRPRGQVLVYDDHGGNQALDVAELLAGGGASVEFVTPERMLSPDVGGLVGSYYFASLAELGVQVSVLRRLVGVRREAGRLVATFGLDGSTWTEEKTCDAIVAECGTTPSSDLYDELVAGSANGGEVDYDELLAMKPQSPRRNPGGTYQLFRVGDAIASRNVHAAMLDAARLCRAI